MTIGIFWGQAKESGIWIGAKRTWRLMTEHDAFYLAMGRLRIRIKRTPRPGSTE